ncbi:hypothetical protein BDW71DRAFT_175755 [Aspergillus fruticulosus]
MEIGLETLLNLGLSLFCFDVSFAVMVIPTNPDPRITWAVQFRNRRGATRASGFSINYRLRGIWICLTWWLCAWSGLSSDILRMRGSCGPGVRTGGSLECLR